MTDDLKKALHDAGLDRIDLGNLLGELEANCSDAVCKTCDNTCQKCRDGNSSYC